MPTTPSEPMDPIGLGTWQVTDPEECLRTVRQALNMGYRHVDTAQIYDNERAVGAGIRAADPSREDVFLATKVAPNQLTPGDLRESVLGSLRRLDIETIDLLYVHWPAGEYVPGTTLPALEALREEGLVRHLGLSNFTPSLLREARGILDVEILAHQVEMHPLLPQDALVEDARRHGMHLVAYSPFRHGTILDHPVLEEVARKHEVSSARVILAWLLDHPGVVAIPRARGEKHLRDNLRAVQLELDPEDHRRIEGIEERDRYIDPPFAPDWE